MKATQTVDIVAFVKAEEVAPYYFDTPYYLERGKRGEKGYALLRDVLKETGYVGVAQVIIRSRQHIAAVIPVDRVLVLNLLRYSYEIRDAKELELPETGEASGVSAKEMEMAKRLVEGMAETWNPEQ